MENKKKEEKTQTKDPPETKEGNANPAEAAETAEPAEQKTEQAGGAEETQSESDALKAEIERLKAESEDFKRKWYYVSAEYENYRKRTSAESARRYAEGRADVVKGLFPIGDNLERALASCFDEATKKGISMVAASFEALLREEKIETIDPLGQPFDAEKCEAIMAVEPAEGEESGTVKQVYRKGYEQNGKVLRYAQVVVVK